MKRVLAGIQVPSYASNAELSAFVEKVYLALGSNYSQTAKALGVWPNTVSQLLNNEQEDSPTIRQKWKIRRTRPRPRDWFRTDDPELAAGKWLEHYRVEQIADGLGETLRHDKCALAELINVLHDYLY